MGHIPIEISSLLCNDLGTRSKKHLKVFGKPEVGSRSVNSYIDLKISNGAVAERLRYRSREQKVPSSSPRSDVNVEVTSQC